MGRLISWEKRAREKWKKEGFLSWVWWNFVVEVWPFVYDRKTIVWLEKDLVGEVEPVEAKIPVQVKVVDDADDDLVPLLLEAAEISWGDSGSVRERLQKGAKCYAAVDSNGIVGFQWVTGRSVATNDVYLGDLDCKPVLPGDQFYFFKAFTFPEYRGRRIIGALKSTAMRDFEARGYRTACTAVRHDNTPNLRALSRLGFATCRIITRYRIFTLLRFYSQKHISPCRASIVTKPHVGLR